MYNYLLFYFPSLPLFCLHFLLRPLHSFSSHFTLLFLCNSSSHFLLQSVFSYSPLLPRYRNMTPLTSLFQLYSFLCLFTLLLPLHFLQLSPSPPISIFLFLFTLYFSPPILIFYLSLHPLLPLCSSSSLSQFTFLLSYFSTTYFPLFLILQSSSSFSHSTLPSPPLPFVSRLLSIATAITAFFQTIFNLPSYLVPFDRINEKTAER